MKYIFTGMLLAGTLLGGCVQVPHLSPPPAHNPANPQAAAGPAIPNSDFIHVADATKQIAMPSVTVGRNLPESANATKDTHPSGTTNAVSGIASMPGMSGMNMGDSSASQPADKKGSQ